MHATQNRRSHALPVTEVTRIDAERSKWDDAFYAFLAERERRSGARPCG
jgi:hypothetical protein